MSAICGLWRLSGREMVESDIKAMVRRIAHRGPDGLTTWRNGGIGLGHAMLHTTAESQAETLPLFDAESGLAITADAWLANRDELGRELGLVGAELAGLADSELILRAYLAFGERCPEHLLGDFSFCIVDTRRLRLFCARDVQGIKPFYYHRAKGGELFCFGTEVKALFALPEVPAEIAELRIAQALTGQILDAAQTGFEDIAALPGSHAMWVDRQGIRQWRYHKWDPEFELRLPSQEAYDEAFREEFSRAVRACHRSAFPLGAFLSGGLDSSSIVCVTDQMLQDGTRDRELHTFSAMFTGLPERLRRPADETEYIQAVLAQTHTTWHRLDIDQWSPFGNIQRAIWHVEDLPIGPNLYLHWAIYREAARTGVRVMLDGIDGDTTISHGLERLPELLRQGRLLVLMRETRALASHYGVPVLPLLWRTAVRPCVPDSAISLWRRIKGTEIPIWGAENVIRPEFALTSGLVAYLEDAIAQEDKTPRSSRREHMEGIQAPVYQAMFDMADKIAGASQIEGRYPFFDRDLLRFCLSLPVEQKLRNGWPRAILRTGMAGALPDLVAQRSSKGNLGGNFLHQLRTTDRDQILRWTGEDGKLIEPYVDLDRYREMLAFFDLEPLHHQRQAEQLFWASTVGLWIEKMRDDPRMETCPPLEGDVPLVSVGGDCAISPNR